MANTFFKFKGFTIHQDRCAMKVTTDACLFGGWIASEIESRKSKIESEKKPEDGETEMENINFDAGRMLDIGTGTGLLSLMIAQKCNIQIDAVEIDPGAFEQAKENIEKTLWKDRIKVWQGDIRTFDLQGKYDVIISNPPFYENELMSPDVKVNLARHGQQLWLADLLTVIRNGLSPNGIFFLLLPFKRLEETRSLLALNRLIITKEVQVRQSEKHNPFRVIISGRLNSEFQGVADFTEISIWDDNRSYTGAFITLLKDYYLAL